MNALSTQTDHWYLWYCYDLRRWEFWATSSIQNSRMHCSSENFNCWLIKLNSRIVVNHATLSKLNNCSFCQLWTASSAKVLPVQTTILYLLPSVETTQKTWSLQLPFNIFQLNEDHNLRRWSTSTESNGGAPWCSGAYQSVLLVCRLSPVSSS